MFLIALAAWLVVRAGERQDATGWMIAAGVTLALANVTAYSSVLFDVVVILLALLTGSRSPAASKPPALLAHRAGRRIVLLTPGLLIGGSRTSTESSNDRDSGRRRASRIYRAGRFLVVVWRRRRRRVCGVVISWVRRESARRPGCWRSWPRGVLLGPLEQANLHTAASLDKHVGLGRLVCRDRGGLRGRQAHRGRSGWEQRAVTCGACVIALAFPVSLGASQSRRSPPSGLTRPAFVAISVRWPKTAKGRMLVEDPSIAEYYLPAGRQWDALVEHPKHRHCRRDAAPAARARRRRGRSRQRGDLRREDRRGLLLARRAELRRHDVAGQASRPISGATVTIT